MTNERTWEISDLDGGNKRIVTFAQFMAEHALKCDQAKQIFIKSIKTNNIRQKD